MRALRWALLIIGVLAAVAPAGVNWNKVWLEPDTVVIDSPGSSIPYRVKGMAAGTHLADLTHNPAMEISSSDESVIAVNRESHRLIAKSAGHAEIHVSFGDRGSVSEATVNSK
jgi:hypothetical protein